MTDSEFYDKAIRLLQEIRADLQLHPIVRARMPEQLDVERSGNPKRSGDSPVRVSDYWSWVENLPDSHMIPAQTAKHLFEIVRRLEQLVDSKPKETA